MLHSVDDDLLMPVAHTSIVAPSQMLARTGGGRRGRCGAGAGKPVPPAFGRGRRRRARRSPRACVGRERSAILLGNFAQQHPRRVALHRARAGRSPRLDRRDAGLPDRGGQQRSARYRRGRVPRAGGLNARAMLAEPAPRLPVAARRARTRHRQSRQALAALEPGRLRRRAVGRSAAARPSYADVHAARRAVHRDRRDVRQLRRPRAERSTASCSRWARRAPGVEGAARAGHRCSACPGFALRHDRGRARPSAAGRRRGRRRALATRIARRRMRSRARRRASSSASPTCRSTSPIRSCAAAPSLQKTADAKPRARRAATRRRSRNAGARRRRRGARARRAAAKPCSRSRSMPRVPDGCVRIARRARSATAGLGRHRRARSRVEARAHGRSRELRACRAWRRLLRRRIGPVGFRGLDAGRRSSPSRSR